jgi:hypothetical protein
VLATQTLDVLEEHQILAVRAMKGLHQMNSRHLARTLSRVRHTRV